MDFDLFETPDFEESKEEAPAWADLDMLMAPPSREKEKEEEPEGHPWDDLDLFMEPPERKEDDEEEVGELELEVELTPETAEMFGIEPEEEPEPEPKPKKPKSKSKKKDKPKKKKEDDDEEDEILTFSKKERKEFNSYARPPRMFWDPVSDSEVLFDQLPYSEKQRLRCRWLVRHREAES